ncbi:SDR family NAD(P)-dependent oxidoreductase [Soonwooa sp.]|uniref:SDR family oxidoreductase n=1 Tax=Soonwooa sp. TaxID=1938592 RepID=UPI00260BBC4D|nr:SDR family NAD(P)-dependent oxidoreductase [Soonwooa sp.]
MKINNNVILITGGSSGIGLALAKRFLSEGNQVIITGRNKEKLNTLKSSNQNLEIFCGDLSDEKVIDNLYQFVFQKYPTLNILINNAAIQLNYSFANEAQVEDKIKYEIATNLTVPILLATKLLPILMKNLDSAIVNVSSGLFLAPKESASVYCATKAGMHIYSKSLRYQLESLGIKVFEIIPALIETPMTEGRGKNKMSPEDLVEEFIKKFKKNHYEIYIGKTKLLKFLSRFFPRIADRIMRNGL